jgi:hypothetical protein
MNNPNDYRAGDKVVIAPEEYLKEKGLHIPHSSVLTGTDRIVVLDLANDGWSVWRGFDKNNAEYFWIPKDAILGHARHVTIDKTLFDKGE